MAKVICIEVGYTKTKIVEMDFRAKNPKVYKHVCIDTPEGIFDDGFLRDDPKFTASIKNAINAQKMKSKQAVVTLTSTKIANREVQIPAVKTNQIENLIEANAKDYFPIDLSEYELGHLVLGYFKDEEGTEKLKVLVMACPKNLIKNYEKLCNDCGLHLISVDYYGNSIFQLMRGEMKNSTEMIIRVEEKSSIALIISEKNLVMQRNIAYGVENAVYTMVNSLAFPQKTYNEAFTEMSRVRCINLSLNPEHNEQTPDRDSKINEKLQGAVLEITESLSPLIGNIARVVDLYNSKNQDNPIKKIHLVGVGSEMHGLAKLFSNELGIRTVTVGVPASVSWSKANNEGNTGKFMTVIGAGINPIGFVNEEKNKNDIKEVNYKNVSILLVVLFALICGYLYFTSFTDLMRAKGEQKRLQLEEEKYSSAVVTYNKYNAVLNLMNAIKDGYDMTTSENDNLLAFLSELEKTLPKDALVKEITSDNTFAKITIQTYDLSTAAKVIQNIREFECAYDVTVDGIKETIVEHTKDEEITDETTTQVADSEETQKGDSEEVNEGSDGGEEAEETSEAEETKIYEFSLSITYWSGIENIQDAEDEAKEGA